MAKQTVAEQFVDLLTRAGVRRLYGVVGDSLNPITTADWTLTGDRTPSLADVIANVDATILIGLSTAAGAFGESIVREMARKTRRPIIFPLSNPTSRSEADPADLARWTDGRVLVATGSPYPPLETDGKRVPVAQCNNVFIFPAVGLGVVASQATRVTAMPQAAAPACRSHTKDHLRD